MTPELRKEASELILHKRGIRVNVQLHVIESDEEIKLRSAHELEQRLLVLWVIFHATPSWRKQLSYQYLEQHDLLSALSQEEADFFLDIDDDLTRVRTSRYAFTFLAWCGGLLDELHLNQKPISLESTLHYFPSLQQAPKIADVINVRQKSQIMDWSDLLYRLHWAVRHAALTNKPSPGNINAEMVKEWHRAVNWMCRYDDEDDWDSVSTETTA
ncbi:MAG: DUF4272 domain-containing protein [Undibacterium sp.]|nr:DUF4272 domain-containing protein [Undibacterium sp.]